MGISIIYLEGLRLFSILFWERGVIFSLVRECVKERLAQYGSVEREWGGVCDPGGPREDRGGGPRGGVSAQPAGALSPHLHHGLHS